jgi:glycosyltransferase involved in cell wall biosynthesis
MKLALVTAFPPSKVTLNEYGYHLVKNFVTHDDISEFILFSDYTKEQKIFDFKNKEKIKVSNCWKFNSYFNLFSILKQARKDKPDAILFNLQFVKFGDKKIPAAMGLLIPFTLRLFGFKTMVLMHNILEQVDLEQAGFSKNKLAQRIYEFIGTTLTRFILKANKVSVTIKKYVEVLEEKYKCENVVLIPHGTFDTIDEPSYEAIEGPKKIMAFGKFGTYKKVEIMIEALLELRKTSKEDLEVVVAGTDSPNTPGYLESVKEKYKDVKGIVFTGYVAENDVERIFRESTIVVFPYTSTTGSSGVLHQAGSFGKAVVMPDLGDLTLLVEEEGYKGAFFDANNAQSLANAINSLLTNDELRKEIAKTNYNAANALSMDKICDKFIQEMKNL